ncbi:cell division protein ZapA [Legionella yabuuchiae]|uniref:cell division protein ZapA n=1 Tax=Legionella yabuuchiae TaxID=376727 RepID=UPI001054E3EC|nr:cell division protein ZapA [Legionella yabuuchiae]
MTKTKSCTIRLLNKVYNIKCPEDEVENLTLAAAQLNNHMIENKRKFHNLDDFQALLLAALHVSNDLIHCQAKQEERQKQLAQFINSLETKISQATEETALEMV